MTTKSTIANIIDTARNWIVAGADTDNAEMAADHKEALARFDAAVEAEDLVAAVNECIALAKTWASNDRSGFAGLDKLTDVLEEDFELPTTDLDGNAATESGRVVDFVRQGNEWVAVVAWDQGTQTHESLERLVDFGLDVGVETAPAMASETFNRDLTDLPIVALSEEGALMNGTILAVDGMRVLVDFGGEYTWCEEIETYEWRVCDSDAYTPETLVFDSVEAFNAYCMHCFGEVPKLSGGVDEMGNTALERVA